ncbi:hypothetical protein CMK18_21265 [Candidatus Poribacteria bacterium]|nr:hypothetical protein [Candidatus Poribacteria bacterium]
MDEEVFDPNLYPSPYPTWGDFFQWINLYYSHGEHAVIYSDNRSPYQLIKVMNTDITDSESNWMMADFVEENWEKGIDGFVKIHSFARFNAKKGMIFSLQNNVAQTNANYVEIMSVLDMEHGDEMAMWVMDKVAYMGLNYPDLSKNEMIDKVAQAAYNIGTQTGMKLTDLKPHNYGFSKDGSAMIFDFNLEEGTETEEGYHSVITALSTHTKV